MRFIKYTSVAILLIIMFSCKEEVCSESPVPQANFSYSRYSCGSGDSWEMCVQFTNLSTDIDNNTKYLWTFGDGTSSDTENPNHKYDFVGEYTVNLKVSNCEGESSYFYLIINFNLSAR